MYYRVTMETLHADKDKACEVIHYYEADNAVDLFIMAGNHIGLKAKGNAKVISMVKPASRQEYELAKMGIL